MNASIRPSGGAVTQFPMMPEKITLGADAKFMTYSIISLGDVKIPRGQGIKEISWSGIFPGKARKNYPFVSSWVDPNTLIKRMEQYRDNGTICKLLVTGTCINYSVYISSFKGKYSGGLGDFYYDIKFIIAREIKIYTTKELKIGTSSKTQRPASKKSNKKSTTGSKTTTYTMDDSYIGNESDYKRWAESVAGIGTAIVVPEWNGPETVKIIVLDGNGEAANETLQKAVYNYIMSPESPLDRLAPPNTILTVSAPELVEIDYTIKSIELEDGYAQEEVLKDFKTGLAKYYKTVNSEGEVKYNWVHSVLTNTPGVDDFEELLMNGGISNIKIKLDQYPNTKSVMVKEGS